jgi:hypothetical protein
LKYREGEKVVNKHIPNEDVPTLSKKLAQRRKLEEKHNSTGKESFIFPNSENRQGRIDAPEDYE